MSNEVRRSVRVADPEGLHARPCAKIARAAGRFRSKTVLVHGARTADARSVLELLGLGLLASADVEIRATGDDAGECVHALEALLTKP